MDTPNSPAVAVPAEAEAYCVKCKGKRKMVNAEVTTVKNGKSALKGKCEVCGTTMMKFLGGKKEAAPAVEAAQ
jgi:ribosomal protein S27E